MDNRRDILVVEDSALQAEMLRRLLEEHGYSVTLAGNGKEALSLLRDSPPELVISDILMPEMDGYELIREIKGDESIRHIPVLLLTTLSDPDSIVRGLEAQADGYLTRPYDPHFLLSKVEETLKAPSDREPSKDRQDLRIIIDGEPHTVSIDPQGFLDLVLSTYDNVIGTSQRLMRVQDELKALNRQLEEKVEERTAHLEAEITRREQLEADLIRSEEQFRVIAQAVTEVLWMTDVEFGTMFYVSPAYERVWGRSTATLYENPRSFVESVLEEDRARVIAQCEQQKTGKPFDHQYRIVRPDGEIRWLWSRGFPVSDENGHVSRYVGITQDITDRVKAQEAQELLATAVEQAADAIIVTDTSGTIQYVNPAFETTTGYTKEEVVGRTPQLLKSGAHPSAFYEELWATVTSGRIWRRRLTNKRKDGALIHAESTVAPVKDERGEIVNYVCVNRDVTEAERLQERLAQSQKMEAIGTLAGGIAHDFNNIIFAMTGYTELALAELPEESEIRSDLERVLQAGNRAAEMVKQILAFSRQTQAERKPLDLTPIIKEGLKFLRAAIPTTIEISLDVEPHLGLISADPTQIHQILMNLCTNAAHAMKDTKGVLSVELTEVDVDEDFATTHPPLVPGKCIKLRVTDTGHGIPAEFINRVFEPYFTTKKHGEGTGLGLSVVHGIVRSHGGLITVYSEPGKGSTFNVFLPVIEEAFSVPEEAAPETILTGHERILLVDDEPMLVEMEQTVLERLGYTVVPETSPVRALELLREDPQAFDLIITDLTMPRMTGIEMAEQVRSVRSEIPIILCTGFSQAVSEEELAKAGIEVLVHKPILKREVATVVRHALDTSPSRGDREP